MTSAEVTSAAATSDPAPSLSRGRPNPLSTAGLDRLALLRHHPEGVADLLARSPVRVVPVCAGRVCVAGDPPALVHPPAGDLDPARGWLLGAVGDVVYVAVEVAADGWDALGGAVELGGLREAGPLLPPHEANLLALATGLATWHATHAFCGACGSPTEVAWAGHLRRCPACGRQHFPRTDPAIIVAVTHAGRLLLGRHPSWPPGIGSVLAGFVEPGESLEDAVAREVREEAGIGVHDVAYHSSQPWPFPGSVMLGFTAQATADVLTTDPEELVDARWYTRDELAAEVVRLSPSLSISRRLIDDWIAGG